jgi:hypothetical protein
MAHTKESQKEKTSVKRSNCFSEEFVVSLGRLSDFYRAVSILNRELGHGNWTTEGKPVRKLRRYDAFNRISFTSDRTIGIVFRVPIANNSISTRLMLELLR